MTYAQRFAAFQYGLQHLACAVEISDLPVSLDGRLAMRKFHHCVRTVEEAAQRAAFWNFTDAEWALARCALVFHDSGRMEKELQRLGKGRLKNPVTDPFHGELSAQIAEQLGLFGGMEEEAVRVLRQAWKYHCTPDVPLDPLSLEYKIAYLIRDSDKADIDAEQLLGGPTETRQQLEMHYFAPWMRELRERSWYITFVESAIRVLWEVNQECEELDEEKIRVWNEIRTYLWAPVSPRAIELFLGHKALTQELWKRISYASYMLYEVAMIFDVKNPAVRSEIEQRGNKRRRLEFVAKRVGAEDMERIEEAFKSGVYA